MRLKIKGFYIILRVVLFFLLFHSELSLACPHDKDYLFSTDLLKRLKDPNVLVIEKAQEIFIYE
jgi:hypothetical protein